MSKERELLKRVIETDDGNSEFYINGKLEWDIKELLAQPETEQLTPREGLAEFKKGYARAELDLKREPLSDEEIFAIGYKAGFAIDSIERDLALDYGFLDEDGGVDNEPYFKLVRAIEKAHGIGINNV